MARLHAFLVAALLALFAGNALAQAAYVHNMNGTATATVGTAERALKIGDLLSSGSVVTTGDRSNLVIKFEDGQVMMLAERSSFRIVDYRYNKQRVADSSAVFSLLRGGLRFISGVIGSTNRNNFRLTAGSATIGIRGSGAVVTFNEVTQAVMLAVTSGALEMVTPQGNVVVGAGEFSSYLRGVAPTAPQPTTQATAAVNASLAGLLGLPAPINEPVMLQASAAAAAAVAEARLLAAQAALQPNNLVLQQTAADAAKRAEDAVFAALDAARLAYQEAMNGGAVPSSPDPTLILDNTAISGTVQQMIAPTPGGGTSCTVSCN
jgi:hypothetical protein